MRCVSDGEARDREMKLLGVGQFALGAVALAAPRAVVAPEAAFAWRLFGARQVCLGAGGFAGVHAARDVNLILQPIDLAVFAHAYRTGAAPPRAARAGIAAAAFALAAAVAHRRRRP